MEVSFSILCWFKSFNGGTCLNSIFSVVVGEDDQMDTTSGDDMSEKGSTNGRRVIPEDEVPWGSLASFALFKLFADWKAQGTNIPPVTPSPVLKPIPKATVSVF